MIKINIHIGEGTRQSIKSIYGRDDYGTVVNVVNDILNRYLDIEYFNPELNTGEDGNDYKICEFCKEKSKHSRMIDVDKKNLEEHDVCENCGSGYPTLE